MSVVLWTALRIVTAVLGAIMLVLIVGGFVKAILGDKGNRHGQE